MKTMIQTYKRWTRQGLLKKYSQKKIAVVGYGGHNTQNLFPILDYYNVPIKNLVTASDATAKLISQIMPPTQGTTQLDTVLNDPEILGIMICVAAHDHYGIAKKALQASKQVFVEKPCAANTSELIEISQLSKTTGSNLIVGLQHRWSPAFQCIKKALKAPQHYAYSYQTGAYAEGDHFYDLWLHPLDTGVFLFGKATVLSATNQSYRQGQNTLFLILQHDNGCIGQLELSTNYSWAQAGFELSVNDKQSVIKCKHYNTVEQIAKPPVIKGIPIEKIKRQDVQTKQTYSFTNAFVPTLNNNELYLKGYFQEVSAFLDAINGQRTYNASSAAAIIDSYKLIDDIKHLLD